ncbi:MAG: GvpL/GvpF family gas vesicle protein [Dehalococcoidales bacterium]|nr:GvpL/GvpF family gas vesicle protein [Dehalococcoidales bacterium]
MESENSGKESLNQVLEYAVPRGNRGRYVYGIAAGEKEISLGPIGLDGCEVFTISCQDLSAIVHCCPLFPYQSEEEEVVKRWVRAHQGVLDAARDQFDIIIPSSFDTIIKPGEDYAVSDQFVRDWLKKDHDCFQTVINRIKGKDEYAVQISYIPSMVGQYLKEPGQEIIRMKNDIAGMSPGRAYIYKQKLEKMVKADQQKQSMAWYQDFLNRIKKHVDRFKIESNRKLDPEKVMLLNLSCLVARESVNNLGEELENINKMEGFSVHFSGPWPTYSFVAEKDVISEEEVYNGAD